MVNMVPYSPHPRRVERIWAPAFVATVTLPSIGKKAHYNNTTEGEACTVLTFQSD